ncbi:MAG: hypothetical protein CMP67_02355 [Flavobacteriales bacterium]|nr:hypothetical protein [Flavobacteriales bacterium]|tara:strand:+ start:6363 stop:7175 length:813 start_codon:yes stop_codon:yes gene_type:complete
MNNDFKKVLNSILSRTGINFNYRVIPDTQTQLTLELRDSNLERGIGYLVYVRLLNARISVEITYETVARQILEYSILSLKENVVAIQSFVQSNELIRELSFVSSQKNIEYQELMEIDGEGLNDLKILMFSKLIDLTNKENALSKIFEVITPLVLFIFPYEEDSLGEVEGGEHNVNQTKYERSRKNRALCLSYHGFDCKACGLNMEEKYGELGKEFIHVHHAKPISSTGEIKINPINDLIPLCPNCHSIVHRVNPPIEVSELKNILNDSKK